MNWFATFDLFLFEKINGAWAYPALDPFFIHAANLHKIPGVSWWLLPGLTLFWIYKQKKRAAGALIVTLLLAGLSDLISYQMVKKISFRQRPHQRSDLACTMRLEYGPKSSSFPSNHAFSTMAMATSLSHYLPAGSPIFYLIALLVGYSRIYVGVHFPSDVVAGWALGFLLAWTGLQILNRKSLWRTIEKRGI